MRKIYLSALLAIMFIITLNAQEYYKFKEVQTIDGVSFSYKWKNEKASKKDSPLILVVRVKNTNQYKVQVTFTVDYYYQTLHKASSEEQICCISSENLWIGDLKKIKFEGGNLTNEQILSKDFIAEFSGITITQSTGCKTKEPKESKDIDQDIIYPN